MPDLDSLIERALREDLGRGDITTSAIIRELRPATGRIVAKEPLVVAGIDVFCQVFGQLDQDLQIVRQCEDGDEVREKALMVELIGNVSSILQGERVALNFLQRLSGIATLTRQFVARVQPYAVKILDTRKTTPGWRTLEKYAVTVGGGVNHRMGLFDAALIKENHISAAGGIKEAVRRIKERVPGTVPIEVETRNLREVEEALYCGVDVIMLDNMDVRLMREAVMMINHRALVEASGGVTLDTVETVASTGVDRISVGALTHSARAVDMSLTIAEGQTC